MPLQIAMTGSTGMIGSALVKALEGKGHGVTPIIRRDTPLKTNRRVIRWDIDYGQIDKAGLEGHDVVIHLAGANLAGERWTPKYKRIIQESRLKSTALLSKTLTELKNPPRLFLSTSAVGYYGNNDFNDKKDEASPMGRGFLAELCHEWEKATQSAELRGIRVVCMRMGMVLSKAGGALGKMLPIFKLGVGGKIASGRQAMSWIALDEIPLIVLHVINCSTLTGPVNFVSPSAVFNEEFTRILGNVIRRPTVIPVPALALRLMFGEMADSLLLGGVNVIPRRLLESGYPFTYPDLKSTLQKILS